MTTLYKYRVYCLTDGKYEYTWGEEENPTFCPIDSSHTIDSSQTSVVEVVDKNIVSIKEESTPTGGNFRAQTVVINTNASETSTTDFSWPFPISILSLQFNTKEDHEGDNFEVAVSPETTVGVLTNIASISDTMLHVSSTVLDHIYVGYNVQLFDGVNTEECGKVLEIDQVNQTISIENALTQSFNPATPTYVRQTVYTVENYEIGPSWHHSLGESKIGGSHIPANTIVRVRYTNNGPSSTKFVVTMEYLY